MRGCGRRFLAPGLLLLMFCAWPLAAAPAPAAQTSRSDEWITECDPGGHAGAADCSITVPFWQTERGRDGSFALVIMLQTGNVGIVGRPFPVRAVLRIDKNPAVECRQTRYCIFPTDRAVAVVNELETGSLILIDVYTANAAFRFSLTPKGFQAGIAQIRAWGYRVPTR
jgi:hypothetical protein